VLDSYLDGSLIETLGQRARKLDKRLSKLCPEEAAVLVLLQRQLMGEAKRRTERPAAKRRAA
jgi:hypothetical protein